MILAQVFESTLPRTSHNVAGGSARILLPANYTLFIIFFFHASFSARSRSDPSRNSPSSSVLQYSSAYSSANMYPPDLRYEQLYLASSAFAKSYWSPVQRFSSSGLAFSPQMQSPSVKLLNQLLELFQEGARFFYFSKHRLFFFSPFCHAGRLLLLTDLSGFACSSNTRKRNRSKGGPLPVHLDPCCCFDFWYAANSKTRSVTEAAARRGRKEKFHNVYATEKIPLGVFPVSIFDTGNT